MAGPAGRLDRRRQGKKRDDNVAKMAPRLMNNTAPMDFHGALGALRTVIKERPDAILVNEGANTLDLARGVIDMYKPRKRLDVGTWGVMGIGMGFAIAAAIETGKPVLAVEGDSAFGFSGMEVETICRYNLPVCIVVFNNNGIYRGTDVNSAGGSDPATTVFVKDARYDKMMEGIRRRRRPCDDARRAEARRQRGHGFRQADPHQRGDRSDGRQRERPHRQSQPAKRREKEIRERRHGQGKKIENKSQAQAGNQEERPEGQDRQEGRQKDGAQRQGRPRDVAAAVETGVGQGRQGARRRAHPRFHPCAVGADLHAVARLVRRRRHQGRASRRRRHHARAVARRAERRQPLFHDAQPQQALDHASTPRTRRASDVLDAPDQELRRAGGEFRAGRARPHGLHLGATSTSSTRA